MTKQEFADWSGKNLIYLDGATGSNLIKAGMPAGVCPELWILEHPDVLIRLQSEYVDAGSNILYAPTFSANRVKLAEYGLADRLDEITRELVSLSKKAAAGRALVAGDITMTGRQLAPMGQMELEELIDIYKEQITSLVGAGVDLLAVETMMSLQETRAAVIAAKEVCDLPILTTLTFETDGRTLYGTDAGTAAVVLDALGVSAVGANCSTGPEGMAGVIRDMADVTALPIIAKPNAGIPCADAEGNTRYDMDALSFASGMETLVRAGAGIIGGCCGTGPEYLRLLRETVGGKKTVPADSPVRREGTRYLASERKTVAFSLDGGVLIVGERINPTGKKKFQASLREGSMEMVRRFAEEQEACGADVLDVNMGMGGIDEKEMMLRAVRELGEVTDLPLSVDSSHADVIEAALRRYPGRALVNSISLEKEKLETLLPVAAKYGAMFILLPLSDEGLPATLEEKIRIIDAVYEKALSLGMKKEDVVVDGLVNTVGANPDAGVQTLKTIRYCRERGFATICGLSNISFGMPERGLVNTAFLTLATAAGLTMAIANPSQELLMGCALAADLLLAKNGASSRYIDYAGTVKERREASGAAAAQSQIREADIPPAVDKAKLQARAAAPQDGAEAQLKRAVLKGDKSGIVSLTRQALQGGAEAKNLLNGVLLPAINEVGDLFDSGKYFLPQLIAGAEAMKNAIGVLEPLLAEEAGTDEMPAVVIATVQGDIHDIGKNLVALMFKNHGFRVIDLGKDVPKEKIVEAALEHGAQIIALSALMTTTMRRMREVVEYAKERGTKAKIIVGGAAVTREYAEEIGADGYSGDAADAVRLAKRLLGLLNS